MIEEYKLRIQVNFMALGYQLEMVEDIFLINFARQIY